MRAKRYAASSRRPRNGASRWWWPLWISTPRSIMSGTTQWQSYWLHKVPPHIRLAWLRQQCLCTGAVSANGATSLPFVRTRALPQGNSASPHVFNQLLREPLQKLVQKWKAAGKPLDWFDGEDLAGLLLWADNVWVYADSWSKLQKRTRSIERVLRRLGLTFGTSSLQVLRGADAPMGTSSLSDGRPFAEVAQMAVLGVLLDGSGRGVVSAAHRRKLAQGVLFKKASLLKSPLLPAAQRISLAYETVVSSFLHGSGGLGVSVGIADECVHLERFIARHCLRIQKREGEGFLDFGKRTKHTHRAAWAKYGFEPIFDMLIRRHFGWCGHVARQDSSSFVLPGIWNWRNVLWWRMAQAAATSHHSGVSHIKFSWVEPTEGRVASVLARIGERSQQIPMFGTHTRLEHFKRRLDITSKLA